jgi:hypothetical protein
VRFDANQYNVDKNVATGEIVINIVRVGGNTGAGAVNYAFSGGTAKAGSDYTPLSGTLNFTSKQTSQQVRLKIFNNTSTSGHKTVMLKLSNPTGSLTLGSPSEVTLNIIDPNSSASVSSSSSSSVATATIGFSASVYGVMENAGSMLITVTRSGITSTAVAVNYGTSNNSASSGTDYSSVSGTLNFGASEITKTFSVPISDNNSIEGNRTFNVVLTNPTNGAVLSQGASSVVINDNEAGVMTGSGSFKFSTDTFTISESQGKAVITVMHATSLVPASVNYSTNGGSALAGTDYTATSGTLSFAAGETSKTFEIPVVKDSLSEGEETIFISLSSSTNGATLSDPYSATVKIND